MRVVKLAVRVVIEQRRSLFSTAAALVLVSAIAAAGGSVLASLGEATLQHYRVDVLGEVSGSMAAPLIPELEERAAGAQMSTIVLEPAAVAVGERLLTVSVGWTSLASELRYRGLPVPENLRRFDGVVFGGDGALADLSGRVVRLASPDKTTRLVRVRQVYQKGSRATTLLVEDPGRLRDHTVTVRLHGGSRPLRSVASLTEGLPLRESDWRDRAAGVLAPLRNRFAFLMGSLIVIAGAVLLPAQLILARRTAGVHSLLLAWGFTESRRSAVVLLTGAAIGAFASAVGGLAGLLTISILNAGGATAVELLPFTWRQDYGLLLPTVVTPSVGWALGTFAVSTLLGVATAFPTVPFVATLIRRRGVWN